MTRGGHYTKPLIDAVYAMAGKVETAGDTTTGAAVDYGAVEDLIGDGVGHIEREAHALQLARLDVDAPYIRVWGETYRNVGRWPGRYRCMAGELEIERTVYRKMGSGAGETVDAVSLRAGVVADGWLPRAAQAMGHLLAKGTSREAEATSRELMRLPYSRSSFERIGHEVGAQYRRVHQRVEPALIEAYEVPEEASSISVSLDRVAVPMEEHVDDAEPGEWLFPEHQEQLKHLEPRFPPNPRVEAAMEAARPRRKRKIQRNWRMAYVASVTLHRAVEGQGERDMEAEALHTIRYGRMPRGNVDTLCRRLVADVRALREKRPDLRVVVLADGAPEMWNLLNWHLRDEALGTQVTRLVDFWHVSEYLGKAAVALEAAHKAWPGAFRRWKATLLDKSGAADEILAELRASGLAVREASADKQPVTDAIRYLSNRGDLVRYAEAAAAGLPVGSGNVEATCKSLVGGRMKRPGARWKEKTGAEVLELRALLLSDRWTVGMALALRPLRKSVQPLSRQEALAA